jgi:hypothetical protein
LTPEAQAWQKGGVKTTKPGKAKNTVKTTARSTKPAAPKRRAKKPSAPVTKANKAVPARPKRTVATVALRPLRRAIFIDVENTTSEAALFDAIESLKIDRREQPVELTAVGNWRTVGPLVARRLCTLGAQLVHSAPARGVRDWSDLWIAVAAGCWLGQATAGDVLEIISNDRAFDAVGDAAAARGVVFRRLQHQRGPVATEPAAEPRRPRRPRGGRRHGRRHGKNGPAPQAAAPASTRADLRPAPVRPAPSHPTPPPPAAHVEEPHGASRDQMIAVIRQLTHSEPGRWVNIDVLEKALKHEGFSRPPGSPRLVTRLRSIKDVEVDAHGRVRIARPAADTVAADLDGKNPLQ